MLTSDGLVMRFTRSRCQQLKCPKNNWKLFIGKWKRKTKIRRKNSFIKLENCLIRSLNKKEWGKFWNLWKKIWNFGKKFKLRKVEKLKNLRRIRVSLS